MKLLIAEDSSPALTALTEMASAWGYEVIPTHDGAAAWRILQEPDAPKLALLDWMMPVMDGREVCRKVKDQFSHQPPYLILVTGMGGEADLVAGLDSGANEYIRKPVSPPELRARLHAGQRVVELQAKVADRVRELERALRQVKQLHGLLPICSYCKMIRDDRNYWRQVEEYVSAHSEAQFSHSICPGCYESIVEPELRQLTGSVPPRPESPAVKPTNTLQELRANERFSCQWKVSFTLQAASGTAVVKDVSEKGICLELPRAVEPGHSFVVELYDECNKQRHVKNVRAVHSAPAGKDRWLVGSQFSQGLSAAELRSMMTPHYGQSKNATQLVG